MLINLYMYCIVCAPPKAVAAMVEECCKFVDQTPDLDTKLKLIDTLRTVSEGKVSCGSANYLNVWIYCVLSWCMLDLQVSSVSALLLLVQLMYFCQIPYSW